MSTIDPAIYKKANEAVAAVRQCTLTINDIVQTDFYKGTSKHAWMNAHYLVLGIIPNTIAQSGYLIVSVSLEDGVPPLGEIDADWFRVVGHIA